MPTEVIIIGASGHGKVIADIVCKEGCKVLGFLDDNPNLQGKNIGDINVLGRVSDYRHYQEAEFLIAIGNPAIRKKVVETLHGIKWHTAVHPAATLSTLQTKIAEGTVVMAGAVVNPGTSIGKHCIINTGAVVDHDNVIGDFAHISVGAKLAGTVTVGENTWIGVGAVVSNNVSICGDSVIGAGAVVVKDITEPGTYIGVPAHIK